MEYRKDKVLDVIIIHIYLIAILFSIATLVVILLIITQLGKVWSWLTNIVESVNQSLGFGFGKRKSAPNVGNPTTGGGPEGR